MEAMEAMSGKSSELPPWLGFWCDYSDEVAGDEGRTGRTGDLGHPQTKCAAVQRRKGGY
jgi:hypothetical protein